MAPSRFLSLITMALLICSVVAQSPTPSPKKSSSSSPTPVSSPPKASAPSPSTKTPKTAAPSPVTVESPLPSSPSPVTSPTSIAETPAEAPGPAENSAVSNWNRFGAAGSITVGLLTAVMVV